MYYLCNTSNPTLASGCWMSLSISLPSGSALPVSTDQWNHIITSVYHTHRGEPLFLPYIHYLYSTDQINNADEMLLSLLADLASIHIKAAIGGPTTLMSVYSSRLPMLS